MSIKLDSDIVTDLSQAISDDLVLLSALHAMELKAQTLAELKELGFPVGLGLCLNSDQSTKILHHLNEVVQNWPDNADSAYLDALAADYAAIYLNAQIGASPHESFWLDEEQLVMQKPMFEVRDCYREQGMQVENWQRCADDHIVNELNFLAEVIKTAQEQDTLSVAAHFLDEHLLRWSGQFADRVAAFSESDFYSGLALLTAAYCEELRDLLAVILDLPRPSPEELDARMSAKQTEPVKVAPPKHASGTGPTW